MSVRNLRVRFLTDRAYNMLFCLAKNRVQQRDRRTDRQTHTVNRTVRASLAALANVLYVRPVLKSVEAGKQRTTKRSQILFLARRIFTQVPISTQLLTNFIILIIPQS